MIYDYDEPGCFILDGCTYSVMCGREFDRTHSYHRVVRIYKDDALGGCFQVPATTHGHLYRAYEAWAVDRPDMDLNTYMNKMFGGL
jgi:hypothetical protein